jgi:hypothetical protein
MPYEIRVVFQTIEAYQSAVDRLYAVFGVDLPEAAETAPLQEVGPPAAVTSLGSVDDGLSADPVFVDEPSAFVVEDQTR